jgi:hypothetical protein
MRRCIFLFIIFLLTFIIFNQTLATVINPPNLTVNKTGTGTGTVTSDPAGINCGVDCSEFYPPGTLVNLTATEDIGSNFVGWSGDPDCSDGQVTLDVSKACTATFNLNRPVTIPTATGNGNITLDTGSAGCGFYNISAKTEAQVANDPSNDYLYGLVEFSLSCSVADVTLTYSGATDLTDYTYRKHGPTVPGNPATTAWYTFNANITGNTVTLHLEDGQLGDDTGVDGVIVDQGGPGQPPQRPQPVAVPTMTEWGMIIFIVLTGIIVAVVYLRRQHYF